MSRSFSVWALLASLWEGRPHNVQRKGFQGPAACGRWQRLLRRVAAARAEVAREPDWCDPAACECWWESDGGVSVFHRSRFLDEPSRDGPLVVEAMQFVNTRAFGRVRREHPRVYIDLPDDGVMAGEQLARFAAALQVAASRVGVTQVRTGVTFRDAP